MAQWDGIGHPPQWESMLSCTWHAEEARLAPQREDQIVVLESARVRRHSSSVQVETGHLGHADVDIARSTEHRSHRMRNVGRHQLRSRDLVKERKERVVIVSVYERDVYWTVHEAARGP